MPRAIRQALLLWLALVGVLLAGLLPLWTIAGWPQAGVLETGQAMPARWLGAALFVLAGLALLLRRQRAIWLVWAGAGMALMVLLFCLVGGNGGPLIERAPPARPRLTVGVASALPLFWEADGARPSEQALRTVSGHRLQPLDRLDAQALAPVSHLLIAQPRLLQPVELVVLDAWVRRGGKALIFADPLLLWPIDLALGDTRRPPLTSLLDPLLTHWGLRLEPAGGAEEGVVRRMLPGGQTLLLVGASRFSLLPGGTCRLEAEGLMALCRIGGGEVGLVADADLLDDRLWLADPLHPNLRAAWASDIVPLLDHWLAAPLAPAPLLDFNRVRSEAALFAGLRWALLAGTIWAGLGAWRLSRREKPGRAGRDEVDQSKRRTKEE